jgi:hypothetical protein
MNRLCATALLSLALVGVSGIEAHAGPVVNPANNPLLGTWVNTAGAYGCDATRTFLAHTQTWVVNGKTVTAPATYAVELPKVYVQEHLGSGGTVAYIVISKDEIMDTLGTGACHWKRK